MENYKDDLEILKALYLNKVLECERSIILINKLSANLTKYANLLKKAQHIVNNSPKTSEKLKNRINELVNEADDL